MATDRAYKFLDELIRTNPDLNARFRAGQVPPFFADILEAYHSSQMSGIAQRSAEKIVARLHKEGLSQRVRNYRREEVAAIIEQESERNVKQ